jgi:restriction system protein
MQRAPERDGFPSETAASARALTTPGASCSRYELPLLRVLVGAGGQGPSREIIDGVGRELKDHLTPLDLDSLPSGGVRWQNRIQFVRLRLIERGLMERDTPRGIWAISDRGREYLARVAEGPDR